MKIRYATIIVRDMDESIRFYTETLGFRIAGHHEPAPGLVITLMRSAGDTMVELIQNPFDEVGLYSVGMDVVDLNATVQELKAKGAKITMEPVPITVGSLAFCQDPNGVRIALIQHYESTDADR